MKTNILRALLAACAAFFVAGSAAAQTAGTVTGHAFAIGKGAGQSGFTSLLCAATEVAIGQSAANPACHALTGDVTMTSGGVVSIGAGKVTNSMLAGSIAASKLVGTDIATVGTITSGTWQATPVAVAYGGTGATTAANARTNLGVVIGTNVQAWDADLDCLAALSAGGIVARTGAGTCATRTVTAPAAGITVSNGDGVAGNPTLTLANDLAALEGLSGTGIARRTGADTWSVGTTVAVSEGGTGGTSASGTLLDNITGFSSTGFLTRTGAGTYAFQSATNGITNGNLAQAAAATLKGNPTGSTGNVQDFTIQGLAARGAPDAANDKLPIYDNAAGTIKYVTPAQIAGASSGTVTSVTCNGGTTVITTSGTCASRELLSANRTYYVRTDGSDSTCSGLSNAAATSAPNCAFLTIQKAYDIVVSSLDLAGYTVTIQIADGTYAPASGTNALLASKAWTGGGGIVVQGNSTTPANVVISTTNANAVMVTAPLPGLLTLKDFKIQTATSGDAISLQSAGNLRFGNMDFGASAGAHLITNAPGAKITAISNYTISGGATIHAAISGQATIAIPVLVTLIGTPNFSVRFVNAIGLAYLDCSSTSFSGAATGSRYGVFINAVIFSNGGSTTFFPGSTAGASGTGGIYN